MAEDERCYRRRFLAPVPITFLLAISANIGFAFSLYFFSIWQRKPAIGLLLTNWPDRARGFARGLRNPAINPPATVRPDDRQPMCARSKRLRVKIRSIIAGILDAGG
jgi:hypothetical protein